MKFITKKRILLFSIVVIVLILVGYVKINTKKVYNATEKYLIENRGYKKTEISNIEVKHSFLNPILSYEEWNIKVSFKDEPNVEYSYYYKDNKITQGGGSGYLDDGIYDHEESFNNKNIRIAGKYIKEQGYTIFKLLGEVDRYKLDKSMLKNTSGNLGLIQTWSVQKVKPDDYFGKEIVVVGFEVRNHPLQKIDSNAKDGVCINVMIVDDKVIGGTSSPNVDTVGGAHSIDGKSLEEVTGLTYKKWSENWEKEYGN